MEEIAHLVPLGFERDRAVVPFRRYPASRVHILTVASERHGHFLFQEQARFTALVRGDLEDLGIETQVHDVDIFDLLKTMAKMAELITLEFRKGARVYVNMSSAGRLTSVACTLAGMYHGVQVYYVRASRYSQTQEERREHGLSICDDVAIDDLENFRLEKPSPGQCRILRLLAERGEMTTKSIMEALASELVEFANAAGYPRLDRRSKQVLLMKLNRRLLDPLERHGHVRRIRVGRYNRIRITNSGKYLASIC